MTLAFRVRRPPARWADVIRAFAESGTDYRWTIEVRDMLNDHPTDADPARARAGHAGRRGPRTGR